MKAPLDLSISVVVPAHNRPAELSRALASLAAQTVRPDEVIVVDDASDEPVTVDEKLHAVLKLRILRHAVNGGAAAARNTGLAEASSKWVSFLDSDDAWPADSLALRLEHLARRQSASPDPRIIHGCGWIDCDPAGRLLRVRHPRPSRSVADFASGCWFSPGSCVIVDRAAVLQAVPGGQDASLRRLEDYDWCLALAMAGFRFEAAPVIGARIELKPSKSSTDIRAAVTALREKWRPILAGGPLWSRMEAYLELELAAAWHRAGHRGRMVGALLRSFARQPRMRLHTSPGWDVRKAPPAD